MSEATVTLLIVDDSPEDRATYRRFLARDVTRRYEITEASGVEAGLERLGENLPDCVILDYAMPDGTGLDFLSEMHESVRENAVPVVMLTGTGDEFVAVEAMKNGARDYLVKDSLSAESLRVAIQGAVYRGAAESQLRSQRAELERLYEEARLANETKDVLLRQLQEASSAKDHFLAALSHELRTPLTPILLALDSLPEGGLNHEVDEVFQVIRRNVALEARLIDDLLDLTRVSRGKLKLDLQSIDLHTALSSVVEICRSDLESKSIEITLKPAATAHFALADAARLQQVFWNLLKNAAKFTPLGGQIVIATANPDNKHVEVSFRDNGLGIPAERLEKIFDAFEQGSPDVTKRYGGLGLGLAISKAIIQAHDGGLRAESPGADQGSTFTVSLETASPTASAEAPEPAHTPKPSANILLVEDHADSARLLALSLKRNGYRVHVAHSVASALDIFRDEPIDLLLSDLGLPDGHGADLLRRASSIRQVKAIAFSGYGFEHDVAETRAAGFQQHLVKPLEPRVLEQAIAQVLDGAASGNPGTSRP